jgi:hypothetical protein
MEKIILSTGRNLVGWRELARNRRHNYLVTLAASPEEITEALSLRCKFLNDKRAARLARSLIPVGDEVCFDAVC